MSNLEQENRPESRIKINRLEIENVKRVKAVQMEPAESGLTIIGGNNTEGKTSVLDAIIWALGGEKYRPSKPGREGSSLPPYIRITLNNGFVVERKGKNSDLKVTDPSGQKAGQRLLDEFVSQLALDLPKFMDAPPKAKADTLLQVIGVGDQLAELESREGSLYSERVTIGRMAERKKKYAEEQEYYPDAPDTMVSPSELIRQQQEILARNGENQRKRERAAQLGQQVAAITAEIENLRERLAEKESLLDAAKEDCRIATLSAQELEDESTAELEKSIANIDETNRKVRANLDKAKADEDARDFERQYESLTKQIADVRNQKKALLDSADLPLPGLSIQNGELIYNGQAWDNMSGSERLIVSTAIVRKLNPECGFVLMDKLEQMDLDTLREFGAWLEKEGLQVIATRVGTGEECSIIISDGYALQPEKGQAAQSWKGRGF